MLKNRLTRCPSIPLHRIREKIRMKIFLEVGGGGSPLGRAVKAVLLGYIVRNMYVYVLIFKGEMGNFTYVSRMLPKVWRENLGKRIKKDKVKWKGKGEHKWTKRKD